MNDTSFGINNEGQLVLSYSNEDTDQLGNANVYNGQNSTLWCNFREAFAEEIKETYQQLRSDGLISYEKLVDRFITNGSDKWSESIYNEDSEFKYISMLKSDNDATNLPQVRGSGEEHFRYFVENRLNYCDSKWYAPDYANDYISLRIYTPIEWAGVEPNADITLTPYSDMYAGVRYKANGTLYQKRTSSGTPVTFSPKGESFESENNETFNDTETAIYGASQLSSLGDLAPLYCGSVNVGSASKLIILKIGDSTEGYVNYNLKELSVGTNKLLKTLDVRNCPNLTVPLGLSGCPNIEEIYATGSGITGIELVDGGCLRIAKLPATISNLTLKNQMFIEDLTLEGYEALRTLWIENTPYIDTLEYLNNAVNVERVRLTDVDWSFDDTSVLYALIERNLSGIDENGTNTDIMWIDGKCHIESLTGAELAEIKAAFPYLTITYTNLTAQLIFMSEDGTKELCRQTINNGGNGVDPTTNGTISKPTKSSTAQYTYTFAGWSKTIGGSASSTALNGVEADRRVYVAFTSTVRTYTVKFYNGSTLLQTVNNVPYGGTATYTGSTPTNNSTGNTADFKFYGWSPSPANITGDTNCRAQFNDLREIADSWATIASNVANGTATSKYAVGAFKTLNVGAVKIPYNFYNGSSVVYNNEIHILGGEASATKHYKFNGTEWVSVSTLPSNFSNHSSVIFNEEIHTFNLSGHYKYNGSEWTKVSTLPYMFSKGCAVVYNNEIHILGGSSNSKKHYKWNKTEWVEVSTLPMYYGSYDSCAVVYDNKIHLLGNNTGSTHTNEHHAWDGTEWTSVSTLPYKMGQGSAVVYDNEIHIFGSYFSSSYYKYHYKFNGTQWVSVSTLLHNFYDGCAVVYDNKIHLMGGAISMDAYSVFDGESWSFVGVTDSIQMQIIAHNHDDLPDGVVKWESLGVLNNKFSSGQAVVFNNEVHRLGGSSSYILHQKWNGTSWTSVGTLPYGFIYGSAVIYNDEIHILGSNNSSSDRTKHYKFNGIEWTEVSTLPYEFYGGSAVVYNNEIHILGGNSNTTKHYKWNGIEWTEVSTLPYEFYYGTAIMYNNEIHILGSYSSVGYYKHYKFNGTEWISVGTLPSAFYYSCTVIYNNEIHILGGSSSSYTNHYKFDGTSWTSVSTLPYGLSSGGAFVYNNKIHILGGGSSNNTNKSFFSLNTTNPKATLTFLAKNLLSEPKPMYNLTADSKRGWIESNLRQYLNGEFLASLPSELQTEITEVKKISDDGKGTSGSLITTNDKLFVPSISEVGAYIVGSMFGEEQGNTYLVFTDAASRIRCTDDGIKHTYWTRTTRSDGVYDCIGTFGNDGEYKQPYDSNTYVLIGFCI